MILAPIDTCHDCGPTEIVAVCSCSCLDHAIRFTYDAEHDMVSVTLVLRDDVGLWRRLVAAWRYIVGGAGNVCAFGGCSEVLIPAGEMFELVHALAVDESEPGELEN